MGSEKSTQELAIQGQKHLKDTIQSAFQILSSMNYELCNPNLWSTSSPLPTNGDATSSDANHHFEMGAAGGALDEARLRFKPSVAALRSVLVAIPNSTNAKAYDIDPMTTDDMDVERLEEQASALNESFEALNQRTVAVVVDPIQSVKGKVVIDAFRLINPQTMMLGQEPRQATSNLGHLKPSIQALIMV